MARQLNFVDVMLRVSRDKAGTFVYEIATNQANATDPGTSKVWDEGLRQWKVAYTVNPKDSIETTLQGIYDLGVVEMDQ